MSTPEPESASATRLSFEIHKSLTQLRMFLEGCVVPRYADGRDPEISGQRNELQVKQHARMLDELERSKMDATDRMFSMQCERMPRRQGQTTMMAQFAAGYVLCFQDAVVELRVPSLTYRTCGPGMTDVEYHSTVDYILSMITEHIHPLVKSPGTCVRENTSLVINWAGTSARVYVSRDGCSEEERAHCLKPVDVVMTDTNEDGLRVDFFNRAV